MDALSALETAACILSITEFVTDLLSASQVSHVQPLHAGKNEPTISETLHNFRTALSHSEIPSELQQPPANAPSPFGDAAALQELVSLRKTAADLLEEIEYILQQSHNEPLQQLNNTETRALLRSRLVGTPYIEKLQRLALSVTNQVDLVLSSRMSELTQTVRSLEGEGRYARPEHESQIDTTARNLHDLRQEMEQRSANRDPGHLAALTEADVRLYKDRITTLTKSENALLADTIVSSLNYNNRPVRFDSIPQAHKDTFQWAFTSRLSDWLLSGSGTFWISGKPGSGKSTFMKFISRHPQTTELLARWAGSPDKVAVAAHFFWIAGTPIQKSWQGLLQSLLFDLLRGRPRVVSLATPGRWAAAKAGQWQAAAEPWSVPELAAALRALATAGDLPLRMCFFIDGLDEYDSDHVELCGVLRELAGSPHVKMCLSSRRWPVFERSFGGEGQESLDIHELTRDDIRKFVNDQLQTQSEWTAEVSKEATLEKAELVDRIVAKADGVFLWAFFVTRSLSEGLSDGEKIGDLNRRFRQLPPDLGKLFQHILEQVDPHDHPKMATILQATVHALEPLHVDLYSHLEKEFDGHVAACPCQSGPERPEEVTARRAQTARSINEKTKGLLRLTYDRVEFLHRTVKDFVLTKDTGEYLSSKLPPYHNSFVSIASAYLGFLRTTRQDHPQVASVIRQGRGMNTSVFIAHLNHALVYASEAVKQTDGPGSRQHRQVEQLLDQYEQTIEDMVSLGHVTITGVNSRHCDGRLLFREELVRHDLAPYIANKLREQPGFFDVFDESPLYAALTPMSRNSGESPAPSTAVLEILLRRGEDPNAPPRQQQPGPGGAPPEAASPWVFFARSTMSVFNMLSGPCMFPALRWNDSLSNGTFGRLMAYGADPNAPLLDRPGARTVFSHFLDIALSRFLGEECFADYLVTLDAFLRAGASLGVPDHSVTRDPGAEAAFGNLARRRPEESVLVSFCTELRGLVARLAADPQRAAFVSSVAERLIMHSSDSIEDLRELGSAISQGCPDHVAASLSRLLKSKIEAHRQQGLTRGNVRGSQPEYVDFNARE